MNIKIMSDSTCDLSPEQIARYQIEIVPLTVSMGGRDYQDGVNVRPDDLYAHVKAHNELPKTAAINLVEYARLFERYSAEYDAVIHVNISSDFSSCYQNARLAAEKFPNVYVVDSRNLSTGHGHLVLQAAEMAEAGMEAAEIAKILEGSVDKVDTSFILDQLEYLKMGGRCSSLTVLGANLLKLKPCIEVKDGKMIVGKKYRGAFDKCLKDYLTDRLKDKTDIVPDRIFITHSGISQARIDLAVETVKALQPFKEVCVTRAGCTVSSHCGPNTIGILYIHK